jgi:hypothetical protein
VMCGMVEDRQECKEVGGGRNSERPRKIACGSLINTDANAVLFCSFLQSRRITLLMSVRTHLHLYIVISTGWILSLI